MKNKFISFFKSTTFWFTTSLLEAIFLMINIINRNDVLKPIFFQKNGSFNVSIIVGVTGVYTLVYSIYLNAHKEEIEIINKPKIKKNNELLDDLNRLIVLSINISTNINKIVGNNLYRYYDQDVKDDSIIKKSQISEDYNEFKNLRYKIRSIILINSRNTKIDNDLLNEVEGLHEKVKNIVTQYQNNMQIIEKVYGKKSNMKSHRFSMRDELVRDKNNLKNYVSREVEENRKYNIKPLVHDIYNQRKKVRDDMIDYFKKQSEQSFF